ncbi:MAG: hypothetical protein GKR95_01920 [Gammaproteobacteria bacterium]|nr:hypothetical protein [Gammaproteobacteria bacterium]
MIQEHPEKDIFIAFVDGRLNAEQVREASWPIEEDSGPQWSPWIFGFCNIK